MIGLPARCHMGRDASHVMDVVLVATGKTGRLVVIEAQVQRTDCTEVLARVGRHVRDLAAEH